MNEPLPGFCGKRFLTTYLTITGFGVHGDSGVKSFKADPHRSKEFQTEPTGFEKSSGRHLGPGCREFESRHSDHQSRKSICSLGFYLLLVRLERSNATVRWTVACRRLDGGNTSIFFLSGRKCKRVSPLGPKMQEWLNAMPAFF